MSWDNLARALHDELCDSFECRYQMPDLDTGLPVKVTQYGHRYPREWWEDVAQVVRDDWANLAELILADRKRYAGGGR